MEKAIDPKIIEFKYPLIKLSNPSICAWITSINSGVSINNIMVYQDGEKYHLLKGKKRLIAYLICGTPTILADIIEKPRDNSFLDNDNL